MSSSPQQSAPSKVASPQQQPSPAVTGAGGTPATVQSPPKVGSSAAVQSPLKVGSSAVVQSPMKVGSSAVVQSPAKVGSSAAVQSPAKVGSSAVVQSQTKVQSPLAQQSSTKAGSPERPATPIHKSAPRPVVCANVVSAEQEDEDYYTRPDFIYGGPFIGVNKPSPFLDSATPMNLPLQGTFKKSFAYFSLAERMPVILTKIIDYLSREGSKIKSANSASNDDVRIFMQSVAKLKNDLVTNKNYDPLVVDTPNAAKWNRWIENQEDKKYFNNSWMFTECYVYRKLWEGCELTKGLKNFDYFEAQKNKSFDDNVELMCIVADRMMTMITKSDKERRKADFITLLKICLWGNKCDLSLSLGSQVNLVQIAKEATEKLRLNPPPPPPPTKGNKEPAAPAPLVVSSDPFQMVLDLKDKLLVDDTVKIADQVTAKGEAMAKAIHANTTFKFKCSCHRLATAAGVPICKEEVPPSPEVPKEGEAKEGKDEKKEEAPKQIPCPAKMVLPQAVLFDIVCDNTGYELFADLCLAHFLIAQKIVQKVRFHVKDMPWFVSDATVKDFRFVIDSCSNSQFSTEASSGATEGGEAKVIKADNLRTLGQQWNQYVADGVFVVMAEDYWTYPHVYKDMKKHDPNLYRKLQYATAIMFKGDLNYRKLMADRNCNPVMTFEPALQGFIPAPIIAVRTVKSETICGLPRGKWDQLNKIDEKWMQSGDYGVIQFCPKAEALKVSDRPCIDYCDKCFGVICPEHTDM